MKKYLIVLISILIFGSANAQKSNLIFFSEKGEAFTLFLNGIRQNKTPQTNVRATNLTVKNYHVKVVFKNRNFGQVNKNIFFNKGKETSYVIKRNRKGVYAFKFRGEVPVSRNSNSSASNANSRNSRASASGGNSRNSASSSASSRSSRNSALPPSSSSNNHSRETTRSASSGETGEVNSVNVSGNESGTNFNMKVSNSDPKERNVSHENDRRVSSNGSHNNNESDFNLKVNDDNDATEESSTNITSYTTTTTTTTTTTSSSSGDPVPTEDSYQRHDETNYNDVKCATPMKQSDFISAKRTIASKSFEDSKLKIAKQITASNCLLASQVREIMQIFEFENTRLKYAKYSYEYTYDVQNYFKVNDAFEYESSIDELDKFINSER